MQFSILSSHALPANESGFVKLMVNLDEAFGVVSENFLSVTLDAGAIRGHWPRVNFSSPLMVNLGKGLSPATLRVGGTSQDLLTYTPDGGIENWESSTNPIQKCSKSNMKPYPNCTSNLQCYNCDGDVSNSSKFTMSSHDWDLVNSFALKAGWELIFGLNVFPRIDREGDRWDSSNARQLIQYTMDKGYQVAWELGNGEYLSIFIVVYTNIKI